MVWSRRAEKDGYNLHMPSPTAEFLREMLSGAEGNLARFEVLSATEGDGAPTRAECSAIQRVQKAVRQLMTTLKAEVADL